MRRRVFVKLAMSTLALPPLGPLGLFAQDSGLPDASLATLLSLAPVVLPASLGRRAVGAVTDRFVVWLREYRAGVIMEHGYGRPEVRRTPASPASKYVEHLAALERAAEAQGQPFSRLPAAAKRGLIEAALRDARIERLPGTPNGQHVVSDLMAFYFQSSEANDLAYRARIGQETCRDIAAVTVRPSPLE
jgi:hypothetical protein